MVPYPQGEGRGVKCRGVWVQPSSLREHCSHQLHSPPTGRHSGGRAPPGPCPAGLAAHSQGALAPAVQAQRPPVTQGLDPGNLGEHRGAPGLLCWWETHRKGPKSIRAVGAGLCDRSERGLPDSSSFLVLWEGSQRVPTCCNPCSMVPHT